MPSNQNIGALVHITKIERAKKRIPTYHIYYDDTLLLSVTEETLIHFRLSKGMRLSEEVLDEIYRFDQIQRCSLQAIRYLSRRGHFEQELRQKLRKKGYETEIIDNTLQDLRQKHYLNDLSLMKQFVHDGIHLRRYGPLLLKQKLLNKGLPADTIETYLQDAYPEKLQQEVATNLAQKKLSVLPEKISAQQRRQKLSAFLQQRGFTWNVIRPIVETLAAEKPENE